MCVLELQDREIIQLKQLPPGATCDSVQTTTAAASDPAPAPAPATEPGTSKMTESTSGGTTGYSTPMHAVLDRAMLSVLNGKAVTPEPVGKDGATELSRLTHQQDLAQKQLQQQQQQQQVQASSGQIQDKSGMVPSGGGRSEVSMVLMVVVALVAGVGQY